MNNMERTSRVPVALLLLVGMCARAPAQIFDGGRYWVDPTTVPPRLTLNSSWYREFARNSDDSEECPVTKGTEVVVFNVKTPWSGTNPYAVALWQSCDPECGGRLRELGIKIFVMPGGDTQLYASFTECRDHIQEFLQGGGLYVGSCGGFGYLSSQRYNMNPEGGIDFLMLTTALDVFPFSHGPLFSFGNWTPLEGQTPVDVMNMPNGGPYFGGEAVLEQLSDGVVGGYAGGFPALNVAIPEDADIFQHFYQLDGQPVAAAHVHGDGRNILGFVYHPEFELGLPTDDAVSTGLFARQVLQPGDTHNLPMLQLKMWQHFAQRLLSAMEIAKLPIDPSIAIPDFLRYRSPRTGTVWTMVEGEPALVPEEMSI